MGLSFNSIYEAPVNVFLRKVDSATAMPTYISFPIPMIIIIDYYLQDVKEIRITIKYLTNNINK